MFSNAKNVVEDYRQRQTKLAKDLSMEYLNKFKSSIHSVAAQVSQALPGNPIFREYECHEQIASAGPGHAWKIYSGIKNTTKQPVSIWLFDKKYCEKWPKNDKEAFPELLKRGVSQLTRLRHPRLLIVEHALEESRDTLAFCTEPVIASLSNIFGDSDSQQAFKNDKFSFEEIEIKHGLFQLSEALAFLHNDAKILHGNICSNSIIVNEKGAWKLAGFDFCIAGTPGNNLTFVYNVEERSRRSMSIMSPSLNYSAPELVNGVKCDTYGDIFSLGMLAYALFNDYYPLFDNKDLLDSFKTNVDKIKSLPAVQFNKLPAELRDDIKCCLNLTPELRPDAIQFTKIVYFDDTLVKTLNYLESLMQMDNTQKMQFFKGLPQVLPKFPRRPQLQKVLPYLTAEFTTPQLIPFILPSIFIISETATDEEYIQIVFPPLIPVFAMTNPYQIVLLLLQKMPLFLQKTREGDIKKYVLPLIYGAIMNENLKIQELCLSIVPSIGKLVERDQMKTQLLPKLLKLSLEGSVVSVRIQTLVCIGKLMPTLESWMVSDQILPALPKINSKEPGILMAILGIYKLAHENEKFGIGREQCAKSVLPFLISTTVENTLNLNQFEQYVTMIKVLFEKVEKEQRSRLQQLSAGQEEQRNFQDFTEMINSDSTKVNSGPDLDALSELFGPAKTDNGINGSTKQSGQLSLEEKKRLALEGEKPTVLEPMRTTTKPQPMNSMTSRTQFGSSTMATNSLFDTGLTSKPMNAFPAPPKAPIDSFNFDNLMATVAPPKNDSSFGSFSSSSMKTSAPAPFSLPPPPSATNPVQRNGFNFPPPPGNNSNFVNLNFGGSSTKGNEDILDLFKSNQPQQQHQNSIAVDELLALTNKLPVSNKTGKGKDPFADLLK